MDKPISVGDLVQVIHQHEHLRVLGKIFTVSKISGGGARCGCGCDWRCLGPVAFFIEREGRGALPIAWLKRIPPAEELEGEKSQEKLREPA